MNEERLGISIDETRRILGIGRNLVLELVKLNGFPAVRFKQKIIINKELMIKWLPKILVNMMDINIKFYKMS